MANTYTFTPTNLVSNSSEIVVAVDFNVTVTDGTNSFTFNGHTALNAPPATPIPYAQLTQTEVVSWIEALVGTQMQEQADAELAAYIKRTSTTNGMPWAAA